YVPTLVVVSLNRFYLSTAGAVMPLVVGETDLLVANSLASAAGTVCTFAGLVLATQVAGAAGDGVLLAAVAVMWPFAGWLENRMAKARIVAVAFAVGGGACLVVAPAIDSVTILLLSFALGISYPWRKIPIDTMVQESIPDRFRGRVFSLYDLAFSGARV